MRAAEMMDRTTAAADADIQDYTAACKQGKLADEKPAATIKQRSYRRSICAGYVDRQSGHVRMTE